MNEQAFDVLAPTYDEVFSRSMTGSYQRMISRKYLSEFLKNKSSLEILEINCGTGDDAFWLSSLGHSVIATDASPNMIEVAKSKIQISNGIAPEFSICRFDQLENKFIDRKFDLVFSNFAGLNCASPNELQSLAATVDFLLKPGGHVAVVLFGKYCWWETFYYLCKFQPKKATRRWNENIVEAILNSEKKQPVFYYTVKQFLNLFNGFSLKEKKPVGLFIPPSYLEQSMQKRKSLFQLLSKFEKQFGSVSMLSSFADHTYILLKKRS